MFRELVKMSKQICFIGENSTFGSWVYSKISRTPRELLRNSVHIIHHDFNSSGTACILYTVTLTPPEQRTHYTP